MNEGAYEVLGKRLLIQVEEGQIKTFQESCDRVNRQFSDFERFNLTISDVTTLLNFMADIVKKEEEIEKINTKLNDLLETY